MRAARRARPAVLVAAVAALLALLASALPAAAADTPDAQARAAARLSRHLVRAATAAGALRHLREFQRTADASGGTRAAGTPGYDRSAAYVHDVLKAAGYRVAYETFSFPFAAAAPRTLTVRGRTVPVRPLRETAPLPGGGAARGVTGRVAALPAGAAPGCAAADYGRPRPGRYRGAIALVERGGCGIAAKARAAAAAGAVAVLAYGGAGGRGPGESRSSAAVVPVGGLTGRDGERLARQAAAAARQGGGAVTATLGLREVRERRTTRNVIAETPGGDAGHTAVLGAHLDSVPRGPGINDNGSGAAGLLDVALALAHSGDRLGHRVRFAWWSAEEEGLLGSTAYVRHLTAAQLRSVALYLNFDMIASPNHAELVYDGDGSAPGGPGALPAGSAGLEKGFADYLDSRHLPHQAAEFDGRSDYVPFLAAGVPAGGVFTGAEGVKTREEAEEYGGRAGVAYDPCYHRACDDLSRVDLAALDTNVDVIAHAVGTYAHDLQGVA
ncbi:M28 family peptidase [Streptomyces sp. NPDC047002]|uniref:M28 family peptidase n=1 Tax=Streptomyces sp. NPDC047002 TaxID=3155475 RepID=UPI003452B5B1